LNYPVLRFSVRYKIKPDNALELNKRCLFWESRDTICEEKCGFWILQQAVHTDSREMRIHCTAWKLRSHEEYTDCIKCLLKTYQTDETRIFYL